MKLYRLVPDAELGLITIGNEATVAEDVFYNLGYLFHDDHLSYYGIRDKYGNKGETGRDFMFFLKSPWSCFKLLNHLYINGYVPQVGRILEYDIPDEIVMQGKEAVTNYQGSQAKGVIIPIELLQKDCEKITTPDQDLKESFHKEAANLSIDSLKAISDVVFEDGMRIDLRSCKKGEPRFEFNSLLSYRNSSKNIEALNEKRLDFSNRDYLNCFKTNIITGRSMLISEIDRKLFFAVMCEEKGEKELSTLMEKSNGILTGDNYIEYDHDPEAIHYSTVASFI